MVLPIQYVTLWRKVMKDKFMARAVQLALDNVGRGTGGPFAAIVVKGNSIISEGQNYVTSSNDPTAHAEIVAVRLACKTLGHFELKGCELYSTCEPCPMCWGAIYWARLDKIYFANTTSDAAEIGFDDSFIVQELRLPHHQRKIPAEQILRHEAIKAFQMWAKKTDKVDY
jgi:guanine deaminase